MTAGLFASPLEKGCQKFGGFTGCDWDHGEARESILDDLQGPPNRVATVGSLAIMATITVSSKASKRAG
jgi:hypothetical protein